jgi:plastocyanin
MRKRLVIVLALSVAVTVPACSSSEKVGAGIDVEKLNEKAGRLGEFEAQNKEGENAAGFVGEQEQKEEEQQQAAQQQAAQQQAELNRLAEEESTVSFEINASGFNPYYIRVFQGGIIQVTNKDSQPRSVTADRGEFDSGSLAPGAQWTYEATTLGKFNFHDETRPFVVGTLEVLAG